MSEPHIHQSGLAPDDGNEPEVTVGEPQPFLGPEPIGSASSPERTIPMTAVTAIAVLIALVVGGLSGYLLARGSHDVSEEGRMAYACALIENVQQTHQAPEDWGDFEDQAYSDVAAASGLLGGFMPTGDEIDTFWELGNQLLGALSQLDAEALTVAVDTTHRECQNR